MLLDLESYHADLWVFDNDNTLYDAQTAQAIINKRFIKFIAKSCKISEAKAVIRRQKLLSRHRTKYTLVALIHEGFDYDDVVQEVYLVKDPRELKPIPNNRLIGLISKLSGEKWILTNNPSEYAKLIFREIGIGHFFSSVIGIREMGFVQKPNEASFDRLKGMINQGKKIVFVDNNIDNIVVAKKIGCQTIHLGDDNGECGEVD